MYEDSWYNFVPDANANQPPAAAAPGHRRKESSSLLQQPNGTGPDTNANKRAPEPVYEEVEVKGPPEATVPRRAASYTNLHLASASKTIDESTKAKKRSRHGRAWEALMLRQDGPDVAFQSSSSSNECTSLDDELLEANQHEYLLYRDQLLLTERHLDGLINDANSTLELLTKLSTSFQSVETQTSTFQSQCETLLTEQQRLEKLANEVGTDLYYYGYLEKASRRLNAPGAGRLVDDSGFGDMIEDIDACIKFMASHEGYRERDSYLARYNALLTKALHLLDHGFTTHLEKISSDTAQQITTSKSNSTRHALAFGRFEELMLDTYSLLPNVQKILKTSYDQYGRLKDASHDGSIYTTTALNILRTYLTTRDRDLRSMTQHDFEEYQRESKELSVETASRNLIKQLFERLYSEDGMFFKLFDMEPAWTTSPQSVFQNIKTIQTAMVHPGNIVPIATNLQSVLQTSELQTVCNLVGWLASEYSLSEIDDDETAIAKKHREYAARLLVEHLWPFTDNAFEVEITKSISRAAVPDDALKIAPVEDGISSSNAYPLMKKAIELLAMFDHAMPKERSSKDSAIVFKIVRESIQVLQRAEARIQSLKLETDSDLFMVKNLLILKNELVSLEIGDIRSQQPESMQHFSQIWDTLSPQNWVGFLGNFLGGWSRGGGGGSSVTAKTLTVEDMSEQLDELLRQSIYAFTRRWGGLIDASRKRKMGTRPIAKLEEELETMLQTAFSNQPDVIAKLKEAIEMNTEAQEGTEAKK